MSTGDLSPASTILLASSPAAVTPDQIKTFNDIFNYCPSRLKRSSSWGQIGGKRSRLEDFLKPDDLSPKPVVSHIMSPAPGSSIISTESCVMSNKFKSLKVSPAKSLKVSPMPKESPRSKESQRTPAELDMGSAVEVEERKFVVAKCNGFFRTNM